MDSIIEKLVALVNEFDPASLIPEINTILGWVELFSRLCVMAAPVITLVLGLWYLLLPPKEANHAAGYRFYFGMGSVEAWRFTQKLAGIVLGAEGLVLSIVMFLICGNFRGMDAMAMVSKAITCILWELGLLFISHIVINLVILLRYNRKGNLRKWIKSDSKKRK
jgi:hypothetical protein